MQFDFMDARETLPGRKKAQKLPKIGQNRQKSGIFANFRGSAVFFTKSAAPAFGEHFSSTQRYLGLFRRLTGVLYDLFEALLG